MITKSLPRAKPSKPQFPNAGWKDKEVHEDDCVRDGSDPDQVHQMDVEVKGDGNNSKVVVNS